METPDKEVTSVRPSSPLSSSVRSRSSTRSRSRARGKSKSRTNLRLVRFGAPILVNVQGRQAVRCFAISFNVTQISYPFPRNHPGLPRVTECLGLWSFAGCTNLVRVIFQVEARS